MTVGVLATAGYLLLPDETVASTVVYNGAGLASVLMIIVGIRRHRPPLARAWYVFAAGVLGFVAADITYEVTGLILGEHPFPYWDDALYLAAYPLLWTGLMLAARGRARGDLPSMIDAAVAATAVGLLYWVFMIAPALASQHLPVLERLVTLGYPLCDVLMCAMVTRLLSVTGARRPAVLLLAAGCALSLVGDVAWSLTESFSAYSGSVINAVYIVGYVCWAGAALHPSMAGRDTSAGRARFGAGRMTLLLVCTLVVPAVLFAQGLRGESINWAAIGAGTVVLFVLVMARLRGFVGQVRAQSERLETLAMHDDLTGLPNRRGLEDRLAEAGGAQVCLLDLNGFKQINDRLGHAVGDQLIIAVAERLRAELREEDVLARMGGDEFAILLAGAAGETDAGAVADRLSEALRRPFAVGGHRMLVGAAIGIAGDERGDGSMEILRRADVAMYAAKTAGLPSRRWSADLDDQAGEEDRLGADLRAALETGQFHLVYQPIVALPGGETRYVETLIRWTHPVRGFVSPAEFIPVAERNGLIVELGAWILRTACAQFVAWGGRGPSAISVNVSARQLAEPGFALAVAATLATTGMDPADLIIEVTETAVFGGGVAVQAVHDLHALGIKIALDDFGTGHSSLTLLQTVPVDVLKVDKSFVDNLTMAGRHAVIATALIQVSDGLGLTAVAEGVETAEQAAELHRLGYQFAQGYHFGRPVASPEFAVMAR
ncbi:putative bifunctional diguanylate cyclase/phosphodiesterase [Actinoplanes sp. CA-054009]